MLPLAAQVIGNVSRYKVEQVLQHHGIHRQRGMLLEVGVNKPHNLAAGICPMAHSNPLTPGEHRVLLSNNPLTPGEHRVPLSNNHLPMPGEHRVPLSNNPANAWGAQGAAQQQPANAWGAQGAAQQQPANAWGAQGAAQQQPANAWGAQGAAQQQPANAWGAQGAAQQQPANAWGAQGAAQQQPSANAWGAQGAAQQQPSAISWSGTPATGASQPSAAPWEPAPSPSPAAQDPWGQQPATPWGGSTPAQQQGQQSPTAYGGGSAPSWGSPSFGGQAADAWSAQVPQQQYPGQGASSAGTSMPGWQQGGFNPGEGDKTMLRPQSGSGVQGIVRVEEGKEPGRIYDIRKGSLSIGRSRESDIFLEDLAVSRLHASIVNMENGNYALKDEGSANGTKVNGQLVNKYQTYPLQEGDRIQLGQTVLVFAKK